jgi:hypothetical protein
MRHLLAAAFLLLLAGCASTPYRDIVGPRGGGSPLFVPAEPAP